MERRVALKSLALVAGGLISLPSWANGWRTASLPAGSTFLSAPQAALLADIVETIIPATDTPGAKELGVHTLLEKMVADCYEPKAQKTLQNGLKTVGDQAQKNFGKAFGEGDSTQRMAVLTGLGQATDADQKAFYDLVKSLTIRGYLSSEYVMTNLTHFQMAPGFYHGCVPVSPTPPAQKSSKAN